MRRLASGPEIDDEAVGFHAQLLVGFWSSSAMPGSSYRRALIKLMS